MTPPRRFVSSLLTVSVLIAGGGCATLPNVSETMGEAPEGKAPDRIVSAKGLLSPATSKAIMERLERSVDPTDVVQRFTAVIESVTGTPAVKGNAVKLLIDGPATYAAMFAAIQAARVDIDLESYILEDDEEGRRFADLLMKKAAEGVPVHVIYDSLGSLGTAAAFFDRLRDAGIQVVEFNQTNPLKDHGKWGLLHRDHRKILVVDGKLAIIGGINISKVYSSSPSGTRKRKGAPVGWRDTDVQIEGPAAAEFQKLFLDTWRQQKGPSIPEQAELPVRNDAGTALVRALGSTPGETNRITFVAYVAAITFAQHSIHLTNAYFVPDDQILEAFEDAARRGVDVEIILPSITDAPAVLSAQRYRYSELLRAGVKIFERRNVVMHAKTAVIDGIWSTVGSTNMDYLSFLSNNEVNAVILSREFADEMEKAFARDRAASDPISWDKWRRRAEAEKVEEWVAHLFFRWL
ncbi:MAG TPA: phospholipase D-like domain-containing protein [Thermoanaerobaculia bacterium]|nr:phospholipase D-like domain-containing protein [Thermoanaerobaculia bacterium]